MSERRRRAVPGQLARRIQAENQARGQRARTHLERARKRRRSALQRAARSGRRGDRTTQHDPIRRRLVVAGAFAISVIAGAVFGWPTLDAAGTWSAGHPVRIERIAVQGNRLLSSRDVAAATGVAPGQMGADVAPDEVGRRLREHPWIRDAQVLRLPTGKLLISIDEREPAALLAPSDEAGALGWRFIDATGTPFAHRDAPGPSLLDTRTSAEWPRLRGGERLADGQAHPELAAALALTRHVRAEGLAELLAARDGLELRLPEPGDPQGWVLDAGRGRPLVILGHDRLIERLGRLETLLRSQTGELRGTDQIDLRFADRAILRSGKEQVAASS